MIHHVSIAAQNPLRVAQVLAELINGQVAPFPAHPGSYMVLTLDSHGTMIEVLPHNIELMPGVTDEPSQFVPNVYASAYTPTHIALSVSTSETQIKAIADREGWRCVRFDREGFFEVIEVWLENRQLVELLPPTIAQKYVNFMQPESLKSHFEAVA